MGNPKTAGFGKSDGFPAEVKNSTNSYIYVFLFLGKRALIGKGFFI